MEKSLSFGKAGRWHLKKTPIDLHNTIILGEARVGKSGITLGPDGSCIRGRFSKPLAKCRAAKLSPQQNSKNINEPATTSDHSALIFAQSPSAEDFSVHRSLKMGSGKKEAARKERQGKGGDGLDNVKIKGENFYRYDMEGF